VAVLNGGFPAWRALGYEMDTAPPSEVISSTAALEAALAISTTLPKYPAQMKANLVKGLADVQQLVQSGEVQIVDARPAGRFAGTAPEPRASIPSGHMPGAACLCGTIGHACYVCRCPNTAW
jgi:thiosulfate/3-mercaptopyruvate sulfurtransferase